MAAKKVRRAQPPREGRGRSSAPARTRRQHKLISAGKVMTVVVGAPLLAGVVVVVLEHKTWLGRDPEPDREKGPAIVESVDVAAGRATAIDLVMRDSRWEGEKLIPSAAEITVHNRGTGRSVITRAVVTVEESAVIKVCQSEGGPVPLSGEYDLSLPLHPAPEESVEVPVSLQQSADEADRLALRLGVPDRGESNDVYVYRLKFELKADDERLNAGMAVVSLPWAPDNTDAGFYWGAKFDSGEVSLSWLGPDEARVTQCMKDQSAVLQRLLSAGGELSPELSRVRSDLR